MCEGFALSEALTTTLRRDQSDKQYYRILFKKYFTTFFTFCKTSFIPTRALQFPKGSQTTLKNISAGWPRPFRACPEFASGGWGQCWPLL